MPQSNEPPPLSPPVELERLGESTDSERADLEDEVDDGAPGRGYHTLPVVGLGGSAGALGSMQRFFENVDAHSGAAYVVILHLSPDHESLAAEILQRSTPLPVMQVTVPVKVEADHVYVIPPGKNLSMADGKLCLAEIQQARGRRVTVDLFFRTLADTHGPKATAIVLSGADGDGANGIKRIKERGGLTVAQDPTEAEHDSMPRAAIATGMVDWVLPVEEMPARLAAFRASEARLKLPPEKDAPAAPQEQQDVQDEAALREVLTFLRMRMGHDFSYYKRHRPAASRPADAGKQHRDAAALPRFPPHSCR